MEPEPLRVALIGYGTGGRVFHAPLIAATPGLRLATIVTRDAQRRAQAATEHPAAELVASVDALWRRPAGHDLVVVTTPNRFHVEVARAAIEAGLPTVVDKPMAGTAREARQLVEHAASRAVPLTAFHNRRWDGDLLTVRRLLTDGVLGEVLRFESRFERWRPVPNAGWKESGDPAEAGGILLDLGTHLVDQALSLFGPVRSVYAEIDRRRPSARVEDDVFLALAHRTGVRSHLWASAVAAQHGPRLRVLGSRGAFTIWGMDPQEAALRAGARPGAAGWGRSAPQRGARVGTDEDPRPVTPQAGDYPGFYRELVAALRGDGALPVDPWDAVAALEVLDAARRSVAHAAPVDVADPHGPDTGGIRGPAGGVA